MKISWSVVSIISRICAESVGVVQSLIILELLRVESYGLLNIVMGIGASVGVYQNLGISSGSTREITAAKGKSDAFKVFIASALVRYAISLPLALILFFAAEWISGEVNNRPEIVWPLRIFAVTLLIQSLQSVLNSVIQGFKAFKFLFIFQALIALSSLAFYIPLVYFYDLNGYFYAFFLFNLFSTIILFLYAIRLFEKEFELPTKKELVEIIKSVFAIGMFVYIIKIIDTQWRRLGPVVLALSLADYRIAIFSFALFVSSKLVAFSDAITDVSLPSMTSVFEKTKDKFRLSFLVHNTKANLIILTISILFILFKVEIFQVLDFLIGLIRPTRETYLARYGESFSFIDPLVIAFWGFSQLNLLRSGYSVPSKKLFAAVGAHAFLFLATFLNYSFLIALGWEQLMAFSWSMAISGVLSYFVFIAGIKFETKEWYFRFADFVMIAIAILAITLKYSGVSVYLIAIGYIVFNYLFYRSQNKNEIH